MIFLILLYLIILFVEILCQEHYPFDVEVSIFTTGSWPTSNFSSCNMPLELQPFSGIYITTQYLFLYFARLLVLQIKPMFLRNRY